MTEEKRDVVDEIQEALSINIDDLVTELREQPSIYFFYACMWAQAAKKRRMQKMKLKEVEARLGRQLKDALRTDDPKVRVSERMLDDFLAEQPPYQEALRDYTQSEFIENMLDVARDGFKQRGVLLKELSQSHSDDKIYGQEYKVMAEELERRDTKVKRRRSKRTEETMEDGSTTVEVQL